MGGVVLVARLKASRSARRLDASQDIRPALHDGYILCHGGKDKPNSSFRERDTRFFNYEIFIKNIS